MLATMIKRTPMHAHGIGRAKPLHQLRFHSTGSGHSKIAHQVGREQSEQHLPEQ